MGIRYRIFLIIFLSLTTSLSLIYVITDILGLSILLLIFVSFIVSIAATVSAINFLYSDMQDLADIASNIAEGDYKKGNLKALPTERIDDYGSVARSISQISEDLKNQIKMIAKQRDQFGSVLDDLGEGILVTNKNGDVVFANEQFSIILNIQELPSKNIKSLNFPALNYLFKRVESKKRADIEFEVELDDKSTRWVLGSMNQSKTTKEFILVVHDITQLRQLNSMRRDFISNLSHELRTPVSVIRANSETLLDGALENKKDAKSFAKAILHNSERLSLMVSDLIDLSRIEYGDLKLNVQKIDLDHFINEFISSMKSLTKKKDIEIIYEPSKNNRVKADLQALERIMNNLIDNAFKYSEKGSSITISTEQSANQLKVMIADTGSGVSDEDKVYIFDRFYRTASARASDNKGSGLGLAIVKNLANSLDGEVGIESRKPNGSIFWFTLPLEKA